METAEIWSISSRDDEALRQTTVMEGDDFHLDQISRMVILSQNRTKSGPIVKKGPTIRKDYSH